MCGPDWRSLALVREEWHGRASYRMQYGAAICSWELTRKAGRAQAVQRRAACAQGAADELFSRGGTPVHAMASNKLSGAGKRLATHRANGAWVLAAAAALARLTQRWPPSSTGSSCTS